LSFITHGAVQLLTELSEPLITSACADGNVQQIDYISEVVSDEPADDVLVVQLPEDRSCDDYDQVIDNGDSYDDQPAIVQDGGRVNREVLIPFSPTAVSLQAHRHHPYHHNLLFTR